MFKSFGYAIATTSIGLMLAGGTAAASQWPASVVGKWKAVANLSPLLLDITAQGTAGACKAITGVVSAYGTAKDPTAYAEKLAHRLFPNMLSYEVGTPAAFGFAEWNGRSLTDNAPDVMFSMAANTPIRLGIGRESVTSKPSDVFPYVPAARGSAMSA